jgi:hypothetical protein
MQPLGQSAASAFSTDCGEGVRQVNAARRHGGKEPPRQQISRTFLIDQCCGVFRELPLWTRLARYVQLSMPPWIP